MNPFLWIPVGLVIVIVVGALVTAGALFERERLQNPEGERGLKWWAALVVSSVMWPFVAGLWPDSRPVPPPQPDECHYDPEMSRELYGQPGHMAADVFVVDRPTSLALCGRIPVGGRVFMKSVGFTVIRGQMYWDSDSCPCRYNFSGFPVIMCRQHRSDTDPQGEPDDDEDSVGR